MNIRENLQQIINSLPTQTILEIIKEKVTETQLEVTESQQEVTESQQEVTESQQ